MEKLLQFCISQYRILMFMKFQKDVLRNVLSKSNPADTFSHTRKSRVSTKIP